MTPSAGKRTVEKILRIQERAERAGVPLVYLVDSLGFRAVFRPKLISYEDGRTLQAGGIVLRVPSRASFSDLRGDDTLRVDLSIEDAIATKTENGREHPFFIQMKGTARISGRIEGTPLTGTGAGFFETYR